MMKWTVEVDLALTRPVGVHRRLDLVLQLVPHCRTRALLLSLEFFRVHFRSLALRAIGLDPARDWLPIAPAHILGVAAFGSVSDIDESGKIIVLMSQRINALVAKDECQQGIITGYFYGFDLSSTSTNSNRGEVFYALVPDPQGAHSCSVSVASVQRIVPATFIHELQHMISYNQHVLTRGGAQERVWLNEGLSLIAEEIGSKYPAHGPSHGFAI